MRAMTAMAPEDTLSAALDASLGAPATTPDYDLHEAVNEVLADVGLTTADCGGTLTFYGQDPILATPIGRHDGCGWHRSQERRGSGVVASANRRGPGHLPRSAQSVRRFYGFFDGTWETINGRAPPAGPFADNPFMALPFFRETRDGRHVVALNFYPRLHSQCLKFLRCSDSLDSIRNAILQWRADELEFAAAEAGLVVGMIRTTEELRRELQYKEVLSRTPLITLEKIAASDPVPFTPDAKTPLEGIRALGWGT